MACRNGGVNLFIYLFIYLFCAAAKGCLHGREYIIGELDMQ
jgi:hypothetical protein